MYEIGKHYEPTRTVKAGQKSTPYERLVEAICKKAASDAKGKSKYWRDDAIRFFRSAWFSRMTGLDGEEILDGLIYWR